MDVLNLNLESFMVEFKDGSVDNVGAPNTSATAKLFDPEDVALRAFGDSQVKLVASDVDGNEVQVAMSPAQARSVRSDLDALSDDGEILE